MDTQLRNLRIYPSKEKTYEQELKMLQKSNISHRNKELIAEFQNQLYSQEAKFYRVAKLTGQMRRFCETLQVDLDKVLKKDVVNIVAHYAQLQTISEATKCDYRRLIKQFYGWFEDEDPRLNINYKKASDEEMELMDDVKKLYKYIQKDLKRNYPKKQIDFNLIIKDEDVKKVVDAGCNTAKEKAFITSLHETGARIGEFLNIRMEDIDKSNSNYWLIRLEGKTGERQVPIVKSIPFLMAYLDVHPLKNQIKSYLWIGDSMRYKNKPMLHRGTQKLIDRCFERAGYIQKEYAEAKLEDGKVRKKLVSKSQTKPCNFHWFRHSRASLLAPKLTEQMLCKYLGWELGSQQVKTYCHLCTKQLEDSFLSMHGMQKEQDNGTPVECICGTLCDKDLRYCHKCKRPLSVEVTMQDKELVNSEINKTVQFMMEMAKNPDQMKAFEEFKKKHTD